MSFSAYQATIAFDDAVWRHGYDSEEAIQARKAAETANIKITGLSDIPEAQPTGAVKSELYRKNLFGKVPRALARDAQLSATETTILVHRVMFTKDFVPKERVVKKIVKGGLGKDTIRNAIARLRDEESPQARRKRERAGNPLQPKLLGYLRRRQRVDRSGEFLEAEEELCLPKCRRPCLVPREWFDGRFSLSELAALIYIQAGTEKGGRPYVREIADRFGWSRQKTAKVVGALVEKGHLKELPDQRHGGRFAGVRFDLANRKTVDLRRVRKSSNGTTGNGKSGNILRTSLHPLPSGETQSRTVLAHRRSRASRTRETLTPDFSRSDFGSIDMTEELRSLIEADKALVLSEELHRDASGLRRLVRTYGPEAMDTIKERLIGAMIDGCQPGKITSWGYFVDALKDEKRAAEMAAQGIRPGDCPGWRNEGHASEGS